MTTTQTIYFVAVVLPHVNMTWKRGRELALYIDGTVSNTYQYNDAGLRTEKKMKDGSRIEYFYNGDLLEYELFFNASGTLTRLHKYIYNAEGNIEFLISKTDKFNNPNLYNAYSYIRNAQNDVVALVRVIRDTGTKLETGRELVATYTYSPYGELIESASHGFDSQTHLYNPFRYRGYYYDRETGLYYLQSRYYDAKTGRFLNGDDLSVLDEDQDSLIENNLFAYCLNNPVNMSDSDGEIAVSNIIGGIVGGVTGAALGVLLAKKLGLRGWKKGALIAAATIGGAVLGAFLGPYVAKLGGKVAAMTKNVASSFKATVRGTRTAIKHSKTVTKLINNASRLKRSKTVMSHLSSRPYTNSILTIQKIMKAGKPMADFSLKNGLKWVVNGTYNGSSGVWELVVDTTTNTIVHFLFRSR